MILQRMSTALRRQDWTTVVLELLIVVVGIYFGLQANDWNQARQDRELERQYLERLHADLVADADQLRFSSELAVRRMGQAELLMVGVEDPEVVLEKPIEFIEAIEKVNWRSDRPISPNTYTELVETGNMTLLTSTDLRDGLAKYYAAADRWKEVIDRVSVERQYSIATAGILGLDTLAEIEESGPSPNLPGISVDDEDALSIASSLGARSRAG